jgi:hypothetical protein
MATVINNPTTDGADSGAGWMFAVIIAIVLVALFFLFGLPAINRSHTSSVNVPDSVDVNVHDGTGSGTTGTTPSGQ